MAKYLTIDDMLDLLTTLSVTDADVFRDRLVNTADQMAAIIADVLQVRAEPTCCDFGISVPFSALKRGDTCPQDLAQYDPVGEFDYSGLD